MLPAFDQIQLRNFLSFFFSFEFVYIVDNTLKKKFIIFNYIAQWILGSKFRNHFITIDYQKGVKFLTIYYKVFQGNNA